MAPRHTEYFKLKELEKWCVQGGLSDLPLKQVIKPKKTPSLTPSFVEMLLTYNIVYV